MGNEDAKPFDGNQGEGNREAGKAYNEDTKRFVESGQVEAGAQDAKKTLEGEEKEELDKAEKAGLDKAKEMDPNVHRDR